MSDWRYALKETVTNSTTDAGRTKFKEALLSDSNVHFRGYGRVFDGLALKDEKMVADGMSLVVEGHSILSTMGIFKASCDELFCIWGLRLLNLAKSRGLSIQFDSEWIPPLLIVG